ncbi:S26 family signal peptidase [Nocardiopsis sp. NPDC058789]|uniref:S26 family signal peptidase n=1 Tax=Nocardiopsis sp. NPDC058789 TaxID=3346634 RepID=UPI003671CF42
MSLVPAVGVLGSLLLTTVLAFAWARFSYAVITVEGRSMSPTLAPGDRVVVRRGRGGARGNAVVVVREPRHGRGWAGNPPVRAGEAVSGTEWYVKRVVAVAGEPYPPALGRSGRVPPRHLALLGDNVLSTDSREYGPCPEHQVLGVVVRRVGGE